MSLNLTDIQEVRPVSRFCAYCGHHFARKAKSKFCSEACLQASVLHPVSGDRLKLAFECSWVPKLRAEAERRGVSTKVLVKSILGMVVRDDMFKAILDE